MLSGNGEKQLLSGIAELNGRLVDIEKHLLELKKLLKNSRQRRRSGKTISKVILLGLEKEVEKLMSQGKTYREIADLISQSTGKNLSKSSIGRFFQAKKS